MSKRSYVSWAHGVLVPFAPRLCKCIDETGLSQVLEGSFFDHVCSVVAVARSAEGDWTGLHSFDMWFPYRWEAGEVFHLLEGHTTVLHKGLLDDDVFHARRALLASSVCFAINQLLSMDQTHARTFRPDVAWVLPLL